MKNYRTTLPPLDLLVFFEAAHRVGSFTGCATELHVSQAAVSKRIHQLEEWIGEPLFIRNGKRLASTETGERLYHTAGMRLEFLRQGLDTLRTHCQATGEAIRGNRIGLGSVALLQSELAAGRLVPLTKDVLRTDRGYYPCHSESAPLAGEAQRLADFLVTAAHGQNAASR